MTAGPGAPGAPTAGPRAPGALRTLRVQVSIALLVAAAACAYVAAKSSADELAAAYRESGRALLATVERSYADDFDARQLARPEALEHDLRELMRLHPQVVAATVYRGAAGGPSAVAARGPRMLTGDATLAVRAIERRGAVGGETRRGGHHAELRAGALARGRGALVLAYDLQPADAAVARRNRRIAIVLAVLLLGFTAFTAFVLGRGIFTPLGRLRAATRRIASGDLESRLGWARRDELGRLAGDFDVMAGQLEEKHRRLEALALLDPLTGLANHRRFQETLVEELERARRERQSVSLVILDIDRVK